jgi:16S rRNA processing protein RimM
VPEPLLPDWVVMGQVAAPYGVKGWIHIQSYTAQPDALGGYSSWWLGNETQGYRPFGLKACKLHGAELVAQLNEIEDRDQALALKGQQIAVPRHLLPAPGQDEYYWSDLMGMQVENPAGAVLGTLVERMETGANDVMVVQGEARQHLIPWVDRFVQKVDPANRRIVVDWEQDY